MVPELGPLGAHLQIPPLCARYDRFSILRSRLFICLQQCNQRPVHRGHQFCGRNCAGNWQTANGQINTGGNVQPQQPVQQSWSTTQQPPQVQNPPTQSSHQSGGDGGGRESYYRSSPARKPLLARLAVKGFVKGLKGLVSQHSQSQSQQQKSATPDPTLISPPITPMSSGMSSSTGTPTTPGLNQPYYTPPSPTNGLPDPNANGQTNGSKSRTLAIATSQPNSTGGDNNDPDFDPFTDPNHGQVTTGAVPVQAQAQVSIQVNTAGGHGNGNWDPSDPNNFPSQQSTWPKSSSVCRLNGCENPVFVDPVTRRAGEYCSQRHRE